MENRSFNVDNSSIDITEKGIKIISKKIIFESAVTPSNIEAT